MDLQCILPFSHRDIDRAQGELIVVRPDHYIGTIVPLDAKAALSNYFTALFGEGA
jgi:hypothetical protein